MNRNEKIIHICNENISHIEEHVSTFLNRSTIIYGTTNSGKSVLIKYLMNFLKEDIPNILVFCPTDDPDSKRFLYKVCTTSMC